MYRRWSKERTRRIWKWRRRRNTIEIKPMDKHIDGATSGPEVTFSHVSLLLLANFVYFSCGLRALIDCNQKNSSSCLPLALCPFHHVLVQHDQPPPKGLQNTILCYCRAKPVFALSLKPLSMGKSSVMLGIANILFGNPSLQGLENRILWTLTHNFRKPHDQTIRPKMLPKCSQMPICIAGNRRG